VKKKKRQQGQPSKPAAAPSLQLRDVRPPLFRGRLTLFLALLAFLAAAPYLNTLPNAFVLDDIGIIVENPLIRDVTNVGKIFTTNYWSRGQKGASGIDPGLYRPLTVFTYALDYSVGKLDPTGYHITNLALHVIASLLLFVIALEIFSSPMAAFAAAALFAVHPVHTEAVTGIVGRAEVLATLFFLLAFWFGRLGTISKTPQLGSAKLRAALYVGAASLFYLLGLFSKETAVTLPAVLLVYDWIHREDFLPSPARRKPADAPTLAFAASRYVAFGVVALVYFAFRKYAVTAPSNIWVGFAGVTPDQRIFTASRVLMEYLALFIFPHPLSAEYWKPALPLARSLFEPGVLLSLVLWIALGYVAVWSLRKARPLFFSMACLFITILPVSNIFFPIGVGKAERILYLPSAGFCLCVAWLYEFLEGKINKKWLLALPLTAILFVFAILTYNRNFDWENDLTLALSTLKIYPTSPLMSSRAGLEYHKRGENDKAIALLEQSIRERPDSAAYHINLGEVYDAVNRGPDAIREFNVALKLDPNSAEVHNDLGAAYFAAGRFDEAIEQFKHTIRLKPDISDAHSNLGGLYLNKNNFDEAIKELDIAIRLNPNNAEAHNNLGTAYLRKARFTEAVERYKEALRLNPNYPDARENLKIALQAKSAGERLKR
jgi:tetratricopeptide (TPR) repeat protein